jgi:Domain of unknown function (DUF4917)
LATGGSLFSTNYDLLLYWALMRAGGALSHIDGCGRELENDTGEYMKEEEQGWSDLKWGKYRDTQNIFYLHGALQFFDTGAEIASAVAAMALDPNRTEKRHGCFMVGILGSGSWM